MVTPGDVMRACRNHFVRGYRLGMWRIEKGRISSEDIRAGDWIAIEGSLHNDGVYCVAENGTLEGAVDEGWYGIVWQLAPPKAFLALCEEISQYEAAHPATDVRSERFGEYSYETAAGRGGAPLRWQAVYTAALTPWRRMLTEVKA